MTTYAGGTQVKSGYYMDARAFSFANVRRDGEQLPGGERTRWIRVPALAVLAAAPAIGGLFVVALPFIGFGVVAHAVGKRIGAGARKATAEIAATVVPGWAPGEAHLAGKPGDAQAPEAGAPETDAKIEAVQKEIEVKRGDR